MNKRQNSIFCLLITYTIQAVTAYTYYRCRDNLTATPNAQFTFSCPDSASIINVQSALLGYSEKSDILVGICPWTDKTSTTCRLAVPDPLLANCNSTFCGSTPCNCTRSTSEPALRCNGQNSCSFPQSITEIPSQRFCVLNNEATFIVVNYTCISGSTLLISTKEATRAVITLTTQSSTSKSHPLPISNFSLSTMTDGVTVVDTSQELALTTTIASYSTLSTGAIVGIAVGSTALILVVIVLITIVIVLDRRSQNGKQNRNSVAVDKSGNNANYEHLSPSTTNLSNEQYASLQKTENSGSNTNRTYEPLDASTTALSNEQYASLQKI